MGIITSNNFPFCLLYSAFFNIEILKMIILPILSLVLIFAQLLTQKNDWRDCFFKAIVL